MDATATALAPSVSGFFFLRKAQDVVLAGPLGDGVVRQTVELQTGRNSVWGEADLFDRGTDLGCGMGPRAIQKVALLEGQLGFQPRPGSLPGAISRLKARQEEDSYQPSG